MRIGFLISHPIQYYVPLFRALAKRCELEVFFAHRQSAEQQADAGFGVAFDWDIDLTSGFANHYLTNVSKRPSTSRFWGCDTPDIAREIIDGRFDAFVVPGWALRSYWQAVQACRRVGVPVLVRGDSQLASERKGLRRIAKRIVLARLLRRFDGFLYVGQRNREFLLHYGASADRLFFSPACVDNGAFRRGSETARQKQVRERAGLYGRKRILFVGRQVRFKNPLDVLRAAALLQNEGTSLEVTFAGSGELAGELEAFARSAGVSVRFLGFVNQTELPVVYAGADVIVLPSTGQETWGLVVNEAMACGIPAVVSDAVGCAPDLIRPGATGETFPLGNIAAMAQAIKTVLALDRSTCRAHLGELMNLYSPGRAAEGIIESASSFRSRLLLQ